MSPFILSHFSQVGASHRIIGRLRSKNKPAPTLDEQIAKVTADIESLQEQIKEKQDELKRLDDMKEEAAKKKLMEAILASGKTMEEIIALINQVR